MQSQAHSLSPAELVGALNAFDVSFLAGGIFGAHLAPAELIANLARAPEARLRAAIIPLVLRHPEYANDVRTAGKSLSDLPQITCECFYTAAVLLQRAYCERLMRLFGAQFILPDWFSAELDLTLTADVDTSLHALGERQTALTALTINWVGTYRHAAERFIKHCEVEQRWNQTLQRAA